MEIDGAEDSRHNLEIVIVSLDIKKSFSRNI